MPAVSPYFRDDESTIWWAELPGLLLIAIARSVGEMGCPAFFASIASATLSASSRVFLGNRFDGRAAFFLAATTVIAAEGGSEPSLMIVFT